LVSLINANWARSSLAEITGKRRKRTNARLTNPETALGRLRREAAARWASALTASASHTRFRDVSRVAWAQGCKSSRDSIAWWVQGTEKAAQAAAARIRSAILR
jgi:hypothetical protein